MLIGRAYAICFIPYCRIEIEDGNRDKDGDGGWGGC